MVLIPIFYYLFAVSSVTFSYESATPDKIVDFYDDGVWVETLAGSSSGESRKFSSRKITITVDGEEKVILTDALELPVVFAENGINIGEFDKVFPSLYSSVSDGMQIQIVRVTKVQEDIEEVIANKTEYRENPEELLGTEKVLVEGSTGLEIVTHEKEFEDGRLVSNTVIARNRISDPVNKVVEKGTKVVVIETTYGKASYYFHPRYPNELITAHNTYPMGSKLRVTNLRNGKSVVVTVVDRGIHSPDRVVDLSTVAFKQIEETWRGLAEVKVELLAN